MTYLSTQKQRRARKIFLYALLSVILFMLAKVYVDSRIFGYKDFIPTNSNKPKIFQDSINDYLTTYSAKSTFDNDSLFYFKYKNKYWILCWSTEQYQHLSIHNIVVMKNKALKNRPLKSYFSSSSGENCPIITNISLRIADKQTIILAINGGKIKQKVVSTNSLAFNLTCSDIGIGSLNGYSDFDIGLTESFYLGNLVILKPLKRLYVIMMVPIETENLKINDLTTLLKMK